VRLELPGNETLVGISTHALYAWVRQARARVETRDVSFQLTHPRGVRQNKMVHYKHT